MHITSSTWYWFSTVLPQQPFNITVSIYIEGFAKCFMLLTWLFTSVEYMAILKLVTLKAGMTSIFYDCQCQIFPKLNKYLPPLPWSYRNPFSSSYCVKRLLNYALNTVFAAYKRSRHDRMSYITTAQIWYILYAFGDLLRWDTRGPLLMSHLSYSRFRTCLLHFSTCHMSSCVCRTWCSRAVYCHVNIFGRLDLHYFLYVLRLLQSTSMESISYEQL